MNIPTRIDSDPHIIDNDLRNIMGNVDDLDYAGYDLDEVDQTRPSTEGIMIPDDKFGRGGSMGDLPRDYVTFDRMIDRNVDDEPYISDKNMPGRVNPNGFYAIDAENYLTTHDQYDAIYKERVNNTRPTRSRYNCRPHMGHRNIRFSKPSENNSMKMEYEPEHNAMQKKEYMDNLEHLGYVGGSAHTGTTGGNGAAKIIVITFASIVGFIILVCIIVLSYLWYTNKN